jgi:hypothetical protein
MTVLWPASFGLMAIHAGSTTSDVILVYAILILVNAILYGAIGAVVAALISLGRGWRGGTDGNSLSNKSW